MANKKWTPAQAAAIDDRGGTLLVGAAAGSGKTAVLVERAVGLILDADAPIEADRLLILTFTKAAAAELRARIGATLTKKILDDPRNARLRRQKLLLQRAPIGTIDAFCLDLLRRHFAALDIPPDFSSAEDGGLQQLRDEALSETMEQAVQSEAFCAFADLYGKGRTDAAAGNTILQIYDFLQALPNPDAALAGFLAPWQTPGSFPDSAWAKLLCSEVKTLCEEGALLAEKALAILKQDLELARAEAEASKKTPAAKESAVQKVNDKFSEPMERLERAAADCRAAATAAQDGWQRVYETLAPWRSETPPPAPGIKGMKKRLAGENRETVKALAARITDNWEKLLAMIPCSVAQAEQDRAEAAPMLAALGAAVQDFGQRYYAKKLEHKLLDFSDFEHLALRLLQTPEGGRTPLCEKISAGFDAVMVDEYQDTNALQDALYHCLARPAGDNLFFVGDIKQSIYRFRQADPDVFLEKQASFPPLAGNRARPRPPAGEHGSPAALALDANFRSAPAVVEGINFLFAEVMSPALGGVVYGPGQALICGAPGEYTGSVEAHVLRAQQSPGDAAYIAAEIRRMLDEGFPVRAENGGTRPLRCEDCCILLTTRGWFSEYEEALEAEGIPVYADTADDLFSAPQMRPLIALLRSIDNPSRNIELAASMRSALFGFTDDDLLRLRAAQKKRSLYGALVAAAESGGTDAFAEKCAAFYARLSALRRLSRSIPVDELLEEIFASTGYLAAVGAGQNGARRRDELRRFSAWAATAGAGGLSALIRAIDAAEAAGGRNDSAPGKSKPGCVSIMTIHRSKGLQFPVVFLADTAHKFNLEDTKNAVLLHRDLGLGLSLRNTAGWYPTAARLALRRRYEQETRSEQMRLLYVALTRAQDKLVMTIPLEKPENALAKLAPCLYAGAAQGLLASANQFCTWILAALLRHPEGGILREASGLRELEAADTSSRILITLEDAPAPAAVPETHAAEPTLPPDEEMVGRIEESFAWEYPAAAETKIPTKVSVTSVVHRTEATALERPGFLSAAGLTAAEMGTALHAFLEHADFAALAKAKQQGDAALEASISDEAARQLAEKLTDPEVAAHLDLGRILKFLQSEAFVRITAARQVLKEYDFITGLPAAAVLASQNYNVLAPQEPAEPGDLAQATVLVQGIADILLVFDDHLELLDYKTDRGKSEAELLAAYRPQLNLYAQAIDKRFAPLRVSYKGIYSFGLGRLIEA
jgi:ATP-dependent helicase/nuclease subunit A